MIYTLPNPIFQLLEGVFNGDKEKSNKFAEAIEKAIQAIDERATEQIIEKKEEAISTVKEHLRDEMASKEFVRAETNSIEGKIDVLDQKIERLELMIKVLIGLAVFGITLANPGFLELIKMIF